jgi:hypothetical protein
MKQTKILKHVNTSGHVMPDAIRHPEFFWTPAFAGVTVKSSTINAIIFKKEEL